MNEIKLNVFDAGFHLYNAPINAPPPPASCGGMRWVGEVGGGGMALPPGIRILLRICGLIPYP